MQYERLESEPAPRRVEIHVRQQGIAKTIRVKRKRNFAQWWAQRKRVYVA